MEREIYVCDCSSLEHIVAFTYDEEDQFLYIQPRLNPKQSFLKRLRHAVKYVFGYRSRYGDFEEIILNINDIQILKNRLNSIDIRP